LKAAKTEEFHRLLLDWYGRNRRSLPWRRTRDPYRILVSEIMLQQTQVGRVMEKYATFLKRLPTLKKLAAASKASVIRAWTGMGYNNRALRLRELSRIVVTNSGGKIPGETSALQALPGIGRYTAHAVACFAFHKQVPVVDVNVHRVLSRAFRCLTNPGAVQNPDTIWKLAGSILPRRRAYDWNQALMDLGAIYCTSRNPHCDECPVASVCASRNQFSHTKDTRRPRKKEPSRDGIPTRIYRGRIVERLRNSDGGVELTTLGRHVKSRFRKGDTPWLLSVVRKLQADGLVDLRYGRKRAVVSLPRS